MIHLYFISLLLAFTNNQFISGVDASGSFTFVNKCAYTVWPGILSGAGSEPISTTGFVLQQGDSKIIQAPTSWGGRFWARTYCSEDSTGKFSCLTGDCGSGKVECDGGNGALPVSLAEFKLGGGGGLDFYDVSLVDGYNLPLSVVPQGGSGENCLTTGCMVDLNGACPSEMKVTSAQGDNVACKSACAAFNKDEYCCSGAYSNPNTCSPSSYSLAFKNACPRAYSYAYDDKTSTFTCGGGADYIITFCPSPSTSQKSSSGSQNQPPEDDDISSNNGNSNSNSNDNNNYFLPSLNGTMVYDGAMQVNSSGSSTCMDVLRSQVVAGAVAIAATVWHLCRH